jgi:hypothetical protein
MTKVTEENYSGIIRSYITFYSGVGGGLDWPYSRFKLHDFVFYDC